MNNRRLEFSQILRDTTDIKNVYFQPQGDDKLTFPAIIYNLNKVKVDYADGIKYRNKTAYRVLVIDPDPDTVLPTKIHELPLCKFDSYYKANNLNHYAFTVFY